MTRKNKHILFITTANLATNPRLYKEACLAVDNGFAITIIQFVLGNWSDEKSTDLLAHLKKRNNNTEVHIHAVDATRKSKIRWLYFGLLEKASRLLYPLFKNKLGLAAYACSKRTAQIIISFHIKKDKYHLICAHNLGALYPAAYFSNKTNVPFFFDVEDYHPEEYINEDALNQKERRIFLMQQLIPKAAFYTSASPLIGEYTEKLVGHKEKHRVILNAFPKEEFNYAIDLPKNEDELNFVWFSQNISLGRGLEQFFDGLIYWLTKNPSAKISVTLIGNMYPQFQEYINVKIKTHELKTHILIHHIPPVAQKELHQKLAEFDIGIASEQVNSDFNREICLTNKILAYAQAGLFILATDTKAQVAFLKSYDGIGVYNSPNENGFVESLDYIWTNRELIRNKKKNRLNLTEELSWDNESKKLVELWNQVKDL